MSASKTISYAATAATAYFAQELEDTLKQHLDYVDPDWNIARLKERGLRIKREKSWETFIYNNVELFHAGPVESTKIDGSLRFTREIISLLPLKEKAEK